MSEVVIKKTKKLETVDRLLQLLECFTLETPEWGVTELSHRLDLYKSVVHRMLSTLEGRGYVTQNSTTKKYTLGIKIFELGMVVSNQMDLRKIAKPLMDELSQNVNETVMLLVPDGLEGICLEKVESTHSIKSTSPLGRRVPLYAGATSKMLMAYLPEDKIEKIIQDGLQKMTEKTITDPEKLREQLRTIRGEGHCITVGEYTQGSMGIAAPITNYDGDIIASLSVTGPEFRMFEQSESILLQCKYTAAMISQRLGTK
ncbi:IclR family transcriptional regulator [Paenibacillus radicis (ex Xue et al. 2023)]|uniref:IclR family transcriptional regulator n=1 Tax=Paenibacillus radicis (ex Xue et al. 2023) TaxID=2972489 RepID=A0ABT1YHH5_9BACL|nr:IclR family transcriptional regulator [Paenibacillus radicis (ex Xue et al. 2023)]MCR8632642.1 IclR family transcriptional regulator [Paenibacillus radicis (ex Xue et al. 2023)]